jgi:hypothetical protein
VLRFWGGSGGEDGEEGKRGTKVGDSHGGGGGGGWAYFQVCLQKRGGLGFGQGETKGHFGTARCLAQVAVTHGWEADGVGFGRPDEAFEFLDQGYRCGVHVRGPAAAPSSGGIGATLDAGSAGAEAL